MKEVNRVHTIITYALQDAIDRGECYEGTIVLDYFRLCAESEDLIVHAEPNNIKLKVHIKLEFDSSEDMGQSREEIIGEDDEAGEVRTNSDKTSH